MDTNFLAEVLDNSDSKIYNFMINASNQASLARNNNTYPMQLNSIFVIIEPYYIEKLNIEGLDLDIKMDSDGMVTINEKKFEMLPIGPGVKVFGISKHRKE